VVSNPPNHFLFPSKSDRNTCADRLSLRVDRDRTLKYILVSAMFIKMIMAQHLHSW
jgi:hypothetical protein